MLTSNDLALCQHASPVFRVFCQYHDGALFAGDPEYSQQFHLLVNAYIALTSSASGPNAPQWKLVGLEAIRSLSSSSAAISTQTGMAHIQKVIPVLLATLQVDADGAALARIDSHMNPLARRESRRFSVAPEPAALTGEHLVLSTALGALKNVFDTSSYLVLKGVTDTILSYIKDKATPLQWTSVLVTACAKWVPVQIRFAVLTLLVERLVSLPIQDTKTQYLFAHLIHALLSSSANMIGLSVIDIQRALLHQQALLLKNVTNETYTSDSPSISDLVDLLRNCIVALASHIYYATQVPDMITELLSRFQTGLSSHSHSTYGTGSNTPNGTTALSNPPTLHNTLPHSLYISNILKTINKLLAYTSSRAKRGDVYLTIASWDGTQRLLNHPDAEVRASFANTLIMLLQQHDSLDADHIAPLTGTTAFRVTSGPVGRVISELHKLAARTEPLAVSDYLLIYHILSLLATKLQVNGAIRVAALANTLQTESLDLISCYRDSVALSTSASENPVQTKALERGIALSSISLALFHTIAHKHGLKSLYEFASNEITKRQTLGVWCAAIDAPLAHVFTNDLALKTGSSAAELQMKTIEKNPAVFDTLEYVSKDRLATAFAQQFGDIPSEVRAAIVEPLPQQDAFMGGSGVYPGTSVSQRASSEHLGDTLPAAPRARSLRDLNYTNTRKLPTFFFSAEGTSPTPPSNDTDVSVNERDAAPPPQDWRAPEPIAEEQQGDAHHHALAKSNTNNTLTKTRSATSVNGNANGMSRSTSFRTTGTAAAAGGGGGGLLHAHYTNGSGYPVESPGSQNLAFRSASSVCDIRRELSPKVTDLKKAASGRSPAGYAPSFRSQVSAASLGPGSRNIDFDDEDAVSLDQQLLHQHRSARLGAAGGGGGGDLAQFDIGVFLSNVGFDATHERGKLV